MTSLQPSITLDSISTGSACISGSREPSEALLACGHAIDEARGGIRISFGRTNSVEEARRAATITAATCARIRERLRVEAPFS
jgi:cysteine desulfurase